MLEVMHLIAAEEPDLDFPRWSVEWRRHPDDLLILEEKGAGPILRTSAAPPSGLPVNDQKRKTHRVAVSFLNYRPMQKTTLQGKGLIRPYLYVTSHNKDGNYRLTLTPAVAACLDAALNEWDSSDPPDPDAALTYRCQQRHSQDEARVTFRMDQGQLLIEEYPADQDAPGHLLTFDQGTGHSLRNVLTVCTLSVQAGEVRAQRMHTDVAALLASVTTRNGPECPSCTLYDGLLLSQTKLENGKVFHTLNDGRQTLSLGGVTPGFEAQPDGSLVLYSQKVPITLDPDWALIAERLMPEWRAGYRGAFSYSWTPPKGAAFSGRRLHLCTGLDEATGSHLILHETVTGSHTQIPLGRPSDAPAGSSKLQDKAAFDRLVATLHRCTASTATPFRPEGAEHDALNTRRPYELAPPHP